MPWVIFSGFIGDIKTIYCYNLSCEFAFNVVCYFYVSIWIRCWNFCLFLCVVFFLFMCLFYFLLLSHCFHLQFSDVGIIWFLVDIFQYNLFSLLPFYYFFTTICYFAISSYCIRFAYFHYIVSSAELWQIFTFSYFLLNLTLTFINFCSYDQNSI